MLWPLSYTQEMPWQLYTQKLPVHKREHAMTIAIRTFISRAAKLSDNALQIVNVIYHCATNYKCNLTTQFTKSNSGVMYYPCHCTLLSNLRLQRHEMVRDLLTSCNTPQQLGFGCLSPPPPPPNTHAHTLPPPPLTHTHDATDFCPQLFVIKINKKSLAVQILCLSIAAENKKHLVQSS